MSSSIRDRLATTGRLHGAGGDRHAVQGAGHHGHRHLCGVRDFRRTKGECKRLNYFVVIVCVSVCKEFTLLPSTPTNETAAGALVNKMSCGSLVYDAHENVKRRGNFCVCVCVFMCASASVVPYLNAVVMDNFCYETRATLATCSGAAALTNYLASFAVFDVIVTRICMLASCAGAQLRASSFVRQLSFFHYEEHERTHTHTQSARVQKYMVTACACVCVCNQQPAAFAPRCSFNQF